MISATEQTCIRPISSGESITSRIARTDNVRVEFLRCTSSETVRWDLARPQFSLMWVRDKARNAEITVSGRQIDIIAPGRASLWFFPEGDGAEGEVTGKGAFDCAGVFVDPAFLSPTVKQALAQPLAAFSHDALGRAFEELGEELGQQDEVQPMFTEGWAMRTLAYVARASRMPERPQASPSGLAPWQLRRAQEIFRTNLAEPLPMRNVADACKLSVGYFSRAFKISTGVPPHQWVLSERIRIARDLLTRSSTPLVEVAGICGFADQAHFSRTFARFVGASPGAWRREHHI